LAAVWNSLARQLAVVWGLGQAARSMTESAAEHDELIAALERSDLKGATSLLTAHINWHMGFDFEAALDLRRRQVGG
jgi:DNA-binding GntR family transcriptional regulator